VSRDIPRGDGFMSDPQVGSLVEQLYAVLRHVSGGPGSAP